jgi:hypothetical protein
LQARGELAQRVVTPVHGAYTYRQTDVMSLPPPGAPPAAPAIRSDRYTFRAH